MKRKIVDFLPYFLRLEFIKQKIKLKELDKEVDMVWFSKGTSYGCNHGQDFYLIETIELEIYFDSNTGRVLEIIKFGKVLYTGDYHREMIDLAKDYCSGSCNRDSADECEVALNKGKKPRCARYYSIYMKFPKNRKLIGMHKPKYNAKVWQEVRDSMIIDKNKM